MQRIYVEQDIIDIIKKYKLYSCRISQYMYLIGFNRHYMFGNISIVSNELICYIHFNAGYTRLFKKYVFNDEEFKKDISWAMDGMMEKENYKVDRQIENLLK
jgi:hypothetical protein